MFGTPSHLLSEAGSLLQTLAVDWRELVAGSEGFLTSPDRAGLHRHSIVWGEQDKMGHVNNVQYVRYAESGRCNWVRNFGAYFDRENRLLWEELLSSRNIGLILRGFTVDFKFPMTWPDRISVYHKIRDRPTAITESLKLDVMILSETKQRPAAKCLEDIVIYDYHRGKKSALAPFMLEQFVATFNLQEQAKRENMTKLRDIERRVRQLEQHTWDRPDAKEAFG